mmetsp:Transcript_16706/g.20427  ORF Transcript_16706/g.20427 Transcript_16706/m.20427 type:complete len:522 (-) Transcript_16706:192-1757(-)
MTQKNFIGFDLGTSGARISIIAKNVDIDDASSVDNSGKSAYVELYSDSIRWSHYDDADAWINAITTLLENVKTTQPTLLQNVASLCASGTSASCLLIDSNNAGKVSRTPRMYDFDVLSSSNGANSNVGDVSMDGIRAMEILERHAPPKHTARAKTGSLAKLLRWNAEKSLQSGEVLAHQADFVSMFLLNSEPKRQCGAGSQINRRSVTSDWHNCLKLGYDVRKLQWPNWMVDCLQDAGIDERVLPMKVVSPGERIGSISKHLANRFGIPESAVIVGGTTDSNAAFFAAVGGTDALPGTAVTSLGSTLAMKYLSKTYCEDADRGVYSHRFPVFNDNSNRNPKGNTSDKNSKEEAWLTGGASNVGCAILRQEQFTDDELISLSNDIDPGTDSPLGDEYYPLTKKGERFPIADTEREPKLTPKPESRKEYLHGILQGISNVERDGFRVLGDLGALPKQPTVVWSCGGGAKNDMWIEMRQRRLRELFGNEKYGDGDGNSGSVEVKRAPNTEASFGAAILAAATFS